MGARAVSDGGVLGGDLTIVTGSIRWIETFLIGPTWRRMEERQWRVEARGKTDRTFLGCVMARESSKLAEILQIHRTKAETPLLVVILAERGHDGGAIGSDSNYWRSLEGR